MLGQGSVWETNKLFENDGVIMVAKMCMDESTIQLPKTCTNISQNWAGGRGSC